MTSKSPRTLTIGSDISVPSLTNIDLIGTTILDARLKVAVVSPRQIHAAIYHRIVSYAIPIAP